MYVQASRPKSAAPFAMSDGFRTPGHQPALGAGLVAIGSVFRGSMGSKSFAVLCVASAVLCAGIVFAPSARASSPCADTPGEAAARARKVLAEPQDAGMTDRDRAALVCLAEAVAALDARIDALSTDAETVEGPIHAPQGIIITQPPASEGE